MTSLSTPQALSSPEELGALVRACRKAQGLTQAELAGASGVGLRFVGEVEKGKPTCEVGKVLLLLQMLGVRLHATPPGPEA